MVINMLAYVFIYKRLGFMLEIKSYSILKYFGVCSLLMRLVPMLLVEKTLLSPLDCPGHLIGRCVIIDFILRLLSSLFAVFPVFQLHDPCSVPVLLFLACRSVDDRRGSRLGCFPVESWHVISLDFLSSLRASLGALLWA